MRSCCQRREGVRAVRVKVRRAEGLFTTLRRSEAAGAETEPPPYKTLAQPAESVNRWNLGQERLARRFGTNPAKTACRLRQNPAKQEATEFGLHSVGGAYLRRGRGNHANGNVNQAARRLGTARFFGDLGLEIFEGKTEALSQFYFGLPGENASSFRNVRTALLGIVLWKWMKNDRNL